jgi:parallel beta-helix repeat protein
MTGPGSLIGNDIFRGGQLGVHKGGRIIQGNRIHDNNTEDFSWGWESGGIKSVLSDQLVDGNEIFGNNGPGLWWDGAASNIRIVGNRVHDNAAAGIIYEISTDGRIEGNAVWRNGVEDAEWGWGAGILVSSSYGVEVDHNVVAWNGDGISVISQNRSDAPGPVTDISVHDNRVFGVDGWPDSSQNYALAWLQDWSGSLFSAGSNNHGTNNAFWYEGAEGPSRWAWAGDKKHLADFGLTPGGAGSAYLSDAEKTSILTARGVPLTP